MHVQYFTVFDKNYAARGLVMIDSLRRQSSRRVGVVVLALDADAARVARGHADEVLSVEDLGDSEFVATRQTRSHEEFCWTCAPALSHFMLKRAAPGQIVIYLDADLYFFADPAMLLAEMGADKTIMIHPHRFSPDRMQWEASAGIFNVAFVAFRAGTESRSCAARWREQVLALCVKDPERGLCGDQGYLNEWPALYSGLRVMQNIGGGTAPWNVTGYKVAGTPRHPTVNGTPIVFFHFHQLRTIDCDQHPFLGVIDAVGYDFPPEVHELIYDHYVRALKRMALALARRGIPFKSDFAYSLFQFRYYFAGFRFHLVFENFRDKLRYHLSEHVDDPNNERGHNFALRWERRMGQRPFREPLSLRSFFGTLQKLGHAITARAR